MGIDLQCVTSVLRSRPIILQNAQAGQETGVFFSPLLFSVAFFSCILYVSSPSYIRKESVTK